MLTAGYFFFDVAAKVGSDSLQLSKNTISKEKTPPRTPEQRREREVSVPAERFLLHTATLCQPGERRGLGGARRCGPQSARPARRKDTRAAPAAIPALLGQRGRQGDGGQGSSVPALCL